MFHFNILAEYSTGAPSTRPSALGMSDPGVEPLEILEILELETPPYPCPPCPFPCPCPCPCLTSKFEKLWKSLKKCGKV